MSAGQSNLQFSTETVNASATFAAHEDLDFSYVPKHLNFQSVVHLKDLSGSFNFNDGKTFNDSVSVRTFCLG